MAYKLALCDVDHTLLDFDKAERTALETTFEAYDIPFTPENAAVYVAANKEQWKALERGETTQAKLRLERWRQFGLRMGLSLPVEAVCDFYEGELAKGAFPMPGAFEFLQAVSGKMPVYLITNGITFIQQGRFERSGFKPYIKKQLISQEVGFSKPDPTMLNMAMEAEGVQPHETVMLGDSLSSDIQAAINAGADSIHLCWGKPCETCPATYEARDLEEAASIILK
ncbi:MAG: HAD-IA family hydrolase [Clostridia bacterium]|nr:HAD-IA family hydrolase [Clostridia bacterium]